MNDSPCGSQAQSRSQTSEKESSDSDCSPSSVRTKSPSFPVPCPSDPLRQARRLPIRILKMLTAHSHLLHPEYLQPLTSVPVSIELDAKKSPLALLAQTCSQIGKPDPPPSKQSTSNSDKESSARSSTSGHKHGEQHQSLEDKSSFKPYSKAGGECRKDGVGTKAATDKSGFRVPSGGPGTVGSSPFPPHATSPSSSSPPQNTQAQAHRQTHSPPTHPSAHSQGLHMDSKPTAAEQGGPDGSGNTVKKETDLGKSGLDGAQLANSSHVRASANSSNASSASSPRPESKADPQTSQSGLGPAHIAPVSPFKPGHSVFPLPASSMGYHGSIVGAYAGYPSQFVSGLDHTKSTIMGGGLGMPGKHPSSSPLTGASPPSFMQGLCRDPYCLTYPNAPHLGGSNCSSCVHDPSSSLKSGFPLMYPSHHLHSLHPSSLSSSVSPSLSHPLYTYGFMLPNEPPPHACNWVSVAGPCDKRFSSSEELLAHLRTHTALSGVIDGKLLSYPSSVSSAASCHMHLPPPGSPGSLPSSFSLRGSPGLSLARYHPYGKAHLQGAPTMPMHSLPGASPYYSPYALYSQRLGAASALGYQ